MQRALLYFLLLLTTSGFAQVQNYDFLSFRLGNMFNVNPAWVTKDEGINVILNGQTFGSSINFAHRNIMAGVYSGVGERSGLGLKVISDGRGAFQTFRSDISYGYHMKFSGVHSLRLGALAGFNNTNLNISRIENYDRLDLSDPTLTNSYFNTTQFVAGAGILYSVENLVVSASLPQIISTSNPFNSYANMAIFYTIKAGEKFSVQPWISHQNIPTTKNLTGLYVKGSYKDLLWVQAGYQTNKSINAAVGITFENIGISYGFRAANSDFRQVAPSVHEVMLTLRINKKAKKDNTTEGGDNTSLDDIIKRLDNLLKQDVTNENKTDVRSELDKIKEMLKAAEIDNSDPKKAKKVEKQLLLIEEKLKEIEKRLSN